MKIKERDFKVLLKKDSKSYDVHELWVSATNEIKFKLSSGKTYIFDDQNEKLFIGGKEFSPLYSFAINKWNVMLPYITYIEDVDKVKDYLKALGVLMLDQ